MYDFEDCEAECNGIEECVAACEERFWFQEEEE